MYAVIKTGGKQHKVEPGDVIQVELMDVDPGSAVEFDPILIRDDAGKTHVGRGLGKARVLATLIGDTKADKIKVFKYRPKSGYKRTQGHRQRLTVLEIQEIALGDTVAKKEDAAAEPAEEKPAKKAAAKKAAAKKSAAKKTAAKSSSAKKSSAKKPAAKKASGRKSSSKKSSSRKKES